MQPFSLYQPTRLYFGAEQKSDFLTASAGLGKHALLLLGGQSARKLGYADEIESGLRALGIKVTSFSGVEANPHSATINRAAEAARAAGADFVVALGGGSVMDAAKGLAALLHNGAPDIWPYCLGGELAGTLTGAVPIVAIPTTAATASEVTPFSVISNPEVHGKSVLAHEFLKPTLSWLNPGYTASVGPVTTADGAADILSHVFEGYLTGGEDSPLADLHSEAVMETVLTTLPLCQAHPNDLHLRGLLLWASNLALNGYHGAGRAASSFPMHAIEHAMSGRLPSLAHGRGLATIFPAYFRWMLDNGRAQTRLARLGRRLFDIQEPDDQAASLAFIETFTTWLHNNDLLQSVSELGIDSSDFPDIAQYAVTIYGDGKALDAAGPLTAADIVAIFEATAPQSGGRSS